MRKIKTGDWIRLPHYQGGHHWVEAICDEFEWRNGEKMVKARYKTGTLTPFTSLVTGVRKFWPGPTGPVSSLLWKAAGQEDNINPRAMLNAVVPWVRLFEACWENTLAHAFLTMAMDTEGERYCLKDGESAMTLAQAALLAHEAGY
jgi:hypothetical protein